MAESTFREMTVEHLGHSATDADLAMFRTACERLVEQGMTDEEATDVVYGDGDWDERARAILA